MAQFLRARAWWRLGMAGAPALHVTRSVVSLLDAACYLERFPDSHPQIAALDAAGCFRGGAYDPGPEGWPIVTEWQLADQSTAGPADLLAELVRVAPARRRSPAKAAQTTQGAQAVPSTQAAQTPQTAQALLDRRPPRAGFPARHASRRPADQRQDLHHSLQEATGTGRLRHAPGTPDHGELTGERHAGPVAPAHRVGQVDRAA